MESTGPFTTIWEALQPWLGTTATVAATLGILVLTRLILREAASDRQGLPYKRQIASALIVIVGAFAAVVFLPVEPDVRDQILSVLGVLLSAVVAFSSTSLVGNAMAGIMMRMTRNYRPGDFIEVGTITGRVIRQGLFHTEVQLITRDIVALPNLYLSKNPVHVTRGKGTFVAVDVSLGYELRQYDVEEALVAAVSDAKLDEAFVLVEELLDHAIRYRVFGLLEDSRELLTARSRLRRAVISALHSRGMQIVSPQFVNRVEYPVDHGFLPETPEKSASPNHDERPAETDEQAEPGDEGPATDEATSEQGVEAIAFDKAEEAESIERLHKLREKLEHDRQELGAEIKESSDRERKQELRDQQKQVEGRIKRTGEIIAEREEEREESDLEE
ncbi:MAG: mechanosensitive ion channel family protein [Spirochaetota bacterium]